MCKNIVLLSGSPRKEGNTEKLAESFIKGAKSASKNVVVFKVAEMKIGGCLGCEHCFKNKRPGFINLVKSIGVQNWKRQMRLGWKYDKIIDLYCFLEKLS